MSIVVCSSSVMGLCHSRGMHLSAWKELQFRLQPAELSSYKTMKMDLQNWSPVIGCVCSLEKKQYLSKEPFFFFNVGWEWSLLIVCMCAFLLRQLLRLPAAIKLNLSSTLNQLVRHHT